MRTIKHQALFVLPVSLETDIAVTKSSTIAAAAATPHTDEIIDERSTDVAVVSPLTSSRAWSTDKHGRTLLVNPLLCVCVRVLFHFVSRCSHFVRK